jgi:hypothetical protein
MFLRPPGEPTKLKKIVYLIAATFLGLMLSFIAHAFIEMGYLSWAEKKGVTVAFLNGCTLSPLLQVTILGVGVIGGYLLGRLWWRKIYIEKVWIKR